MTLNEDSLTFIDMGNDFNLNNAGTILVMEGRVIIADDREGLFEYTEGKLIQIPGGNKLRMRRVVALLPFDRESMIIATARNGIFLFNMRTGELKNDLVPAVINNSLRKNSISGAVNIPDNRFAVGMAGGEGVYIFSHDGTLLQQVSTKTTGIQESTVTAMYCDYASNSQLWFCTMGYINRAYVSLPVSEFGIETGIRTTIADIREYNGSAFVSDNNGLFGYSVNDSGRVQFTRVEGLDLQIFDLDTITVKMSMCCCSYRKRDCIRWIQWGMLIVFLTREHFTAIKADMYDPSSFARRINRGNHHDSQKLHQVSGM